MCDCERPEFFDVQEPKARREHRCCECHRAIQPGETYCVSSGKWDGQFDSFKQCHECATLFVSFGRYSDASDDCCVSFGGLWESVSEDLHWNSSRKLSASDRTSLVVLMLADRYEAIASQIRDRKRRKLHENKSYSTVM